MVAAFFGAGVAVAFVVSQTVQVCVNVHSAQVSATQSRTNLLLLSPSFQCPSPAQCTAHTQRYTSDCTNGARRCTSDTQRVLCGPFPSFVCAATGGPSLRGSTSLDFSLVFTLCWKTSPVCEMGDGLCNLACVANSSHCAYSQAWDGFLHTGFPCDVDRRSLRRFSALSHQRSAGELSQDASGRTTSMSMVTDDRVEHTPDNDNPRNGRAPLQERDCCVRYPLRRGTLV